MRERERFYTSTDIIKRFDLVSFLKSQIFYPVSLVPIKSNQLQRLGVKPDLFKPERK